MFIKTKWIKEMNFEGEYDGLQKYKMDADPKYGGKGMGAKPKELVLMGLAGCTGMDVISILNKMRQKVDDFQIEVSADISKEEPKIFTKIIIIYILKGKSLDKEKVAKAVKLSQEKYCGVGAMLKQSAEIEYVIKIN